LRDWAVWPLVARAQQRSDRVLRVGILLPNSEGEQEVQTRNAEFIAGLGGAVAWPFAARKARQR
jgi:hypothetical protein